MTTPNNAFRTVVTSILIALVAIMPASTYLLVPKHTEAQVGAALCNVAGAAAQAAALAQSATPLAVPSIEIGPLVNQTAQETGKECGADSIFWVLGKIAIQAISTSIINWINSGFQGSPTFVTNLREFLQLVDVAALEEYLGSDAIAFLCSPWQFNVRFYLESNLLRRPAPRCSLADVIDNIDGFLQGDFSQGGWDGWYRLSTRSNPYVDTLASISGARAHIAGAERRAGNIFSVGRGFLSIPDPDCDAFTAGDSVGAIGAATDQCGYVTPGVVAERQLNKVLGSGVDQLNLADEIDEIITAFISQLINQALTQGLRNL